MSWYIEELSNQVIARYLDITDLQDETHLVEIMNERTYLIEFSQEMTV